MSWLSSAVRKVAGSKLLAPIAAVGGLALGGAGVVAGIGAATRIVRGVKEGLTDRVPAVVEATGALADELAGVKTVAGDAAGGVAVVAQDVLTEGAAISGVVGDATSAGGLRSQAMRAAVNGRPITSAALDARAARAGEASPASRLIRNGVLAGIAVWAANKFILKGGR